MPHKPTALRSKRRPKLEKRLKLSRLDLPRSQTRRFSRLLRCLAQEDTKVVVSLGSGGIRMFAHVAALRFLEKLGAGRYISEVWGASGGAIIGLLYSMGLSADQMVTESAEFMKKQNVKLVPSVFSIAKNIAYETLFSNNSPNILKGFHNIHKSLQAMISRALEIGKVKFPFYCLAYNLETNQTDVLTPCEVPEGLYSNWIYHCEPLEAIIASSSVPILFVPKVIADARGKRVYSDGGTNEEVPSVSIYKKWVRDKEIGLERRKRLLVISVDLHPDLSSLGFLGNWLLKKIPAFQYLQMTIRLADLMRKARIEEQKRVLLGDPNVELWELHFELPGGGLMNVNLIPRVLEVAEKTFPEQFGKINDSLLI